MALIALTTAWLAWGAGQAFLGVPSFDPLPDMDLSNADFPPTAILVPICNENPTEVCARIMAMRQSMQTAHVPVDFAILSDTFDPDALIAERAALAPLLGDEGAANPVYYRNRTDRYGRKAGNVEDFIRKSGGAYEYVVILDADSLMEGDTIRHLVARMEADPSLGLLQTLPKIFGAGSLFGRAMHILCQLSFAGFCTRSGPYAGAHGPVLGA